MKEGKKNESILHNSCLLLLLANNESYKENQQMLTNVGGKWWQILLTWWVLAFVFDATPRMLRSIAKEFDIVLFGVQEVLKHSAIWSWVARVIGCISNNASLCHMERKNKLCRNAIFITKELALLKHPVKLRKSCEEMILLDIRKCSKSDQIMGANKYSC